MTASFHTDSDRPTTGLDSETVVERAAFDDDAWAALVAAMAATGLSTNLETLAPAATWGLTSAPDYPEPAMSTLGLLVNSFAVVLVASTVQALSVAARDDRRVRLMRGQAGKEIP